MNYPTAEMYSMLYDRYLTTRSVSELIDIAGVVENKVVWDLCCGGGHLAEVCYTRKAARVVAVDGSWDMIKEFMARGFNPKRMYCYNQDISTFLRATDNGDFVFEGKDEPDIVLCRQAINYWFGELGIRDLAARMPKGSIFVFNTFNTRPSEIPSVKTYNYNGFNFCEVSWLVLTYLMVHHVQIREGLSPHTTCFRWIPGEEFKAILGKWFDVEVIEKGRTSIYKCVRK